MFLTQAQCDALPYGARVRVTWAGGNGPHEYTVLEKTRQTEHTWVTSPPYLSHHELRFVGPAAPHTTVELLGVGGDCGNATISGPFLSRAYRHDKMRELRQEEKDAAEAWLADYVNKLYGEPVFHVVEGK